MADEGGAGGTGRARPSAALLVVPGTAFWVLVVVGAVTGNSAWIGAALALGAVTAVVVITTAARTSAAQRAERERVWTTGTPATARVVDIGTEGGSINDNPRVDIVLDVSVDGRSPYRADVSAVISKLAIPRIQPGCEIDVRVDPADTSNIALDPKLLY